MCPGGNARPVESGSEEHGTRPKEVLATEDGLKSRPLLLCSRYCTAAAQPVSRNVIVERNEWPDRLRLADGARLAQRRARRRPLDEPGGV